MPPRIHVLRSKLYPERIHPNLTNKTLLKEQIEACHQQDIRVPIYVTIQWDYYTSKRHPEWHIKNPDWTPTGDDVYDDGFYNRLCVNTPYKDFLFKSIEEMFEVVGNVDGLFLDIVGSADNANHYCTEDMLKLGLGPSKKHVREEFYDGVITNFKKDLTTHIHKLDKDATVFYNGGHIGPGIRPSKKYYTHLELESLPSGGWGYLHFPLTSRYARNLGKDILGMTGKFHTSWGDFHSFKNQPALEFECMMMLAMNARCSVGDQLHPSGKIDPVTYNLIGSVYSQVAQKEPWCYQAKALVDIAVMSPEEFDKSHRIPAPSKGAVRLLQEGAHQFDIIDSQSDFSPYKIIILPDSIPVEGNLKSKLEKYISNGGKIIASYESGLDKEKNDFTLSELGVKKVGDGPMEDGELMRGKSFGRNNYAEYVIPKGAIGKGLPETEHVFYKHGIDIEATGGATVLLPKTASYFDRTWAHFCSHKQTPSSGKSEKPAIVQKGNCIYFANPIFTEYGERAPVWDKKLVLNAIELLLAEPLVKSEGPSTLITAINEQAAANRYVMHLLNYVPERRGDSLDVIEDVFPIYNVKLSVKPPKQVRKIRLVPENKSISFKKVNGRLEFKVPKIEGHQMLELS